MMNDIEVVTLGEALVVMDPSEQGYLRHVGAFTKRLGGAELNVATALSRLGHRAGWAGRLGDDEFGHEILGFLRGESVDVSGVCLDAEAPTGLYFKERRALDSMRAYYYRNGSAASRQQFEDLDLDRILSGKILHLTGITPALSESCRQMHESLVSLAVERGVPVSFDANVRWRLFDGRDPWGTLEPLYSRADLLFFSAEEAEHLLGGSGPASVQKALSGSRASMAVVHSESGAFAVDGTEVIHDKAQEVKVVDTVGAGDAFVAGFLSGRLWGWKTMDCLRLANACGACAVSVPGDATSMPLKEEPLSLLHGYKDVER